jgi:integrase/recombinase XerD
MTSEMSARATGRPAWVADIPGPREALPSEIQQFLDYLRVQRNRPATTVAAYRGDLAKFVGWMVSQGTASRFLEDLDGERLRRYQIALADLLPHARTRARRLVAVRQFLAYAYDQGWTKEALGRHVVSPQYTPGDPHPLATNTVVELLAALPKGTLREQRDRALIHFLLATGCRISEALQVNRDELQAAGFRVLGKGGKYRTVYLTPAAWKAVQEYLARRGPDGSPALFISVTNRELPKGQPLPDNRLTPDGARKAIAALRRYLSQTPAGFALASKLLSPHVARHTAATTLLESTGGDVRLVQEVLGHATLDTLKVYTEITDRRKREAYEDLGEYLEREAGRPR